MIELSIMVPTYNRPNQFKRLYNQIKKIIDKYSNVECIIACSSREYLPENSERISIFDTYKYTREQNYITGVENCSGKYILIAEDDDLLNLNAIDEFLQLEKKDDAIFFFSAVQPDYTINRFTYTDYQKASIKKFFDIFGNTFQWGQCISEKNTLLSNMKLFWSEYQNIVKSDEIITIMTLQKMKHMYISNTWLLYIGVGNDNFSWFSDLEKHQEQLYKKIIKDLSDE